MIYVAALVLSLIVTALICALAIVKGNTVHVLNGREPNAGFSFLPAIPFFQLIDLGLAWALAHVVPNVAMVVLFGLHTLFFILWLVSFRHANVEYARALAESRRPVVPGLNPP